MISDIVFVLIFTCADDAVAGAVGYDVDAAPMGEGFPVNGVDCVADADIAEERKVGGAGGGAVVGNLTGVIERRRVEI